MKKQIALFACVSLLFFSVTDLQAQEVDHHCNEESVTDGITTATTTIDTITTSTKQIVKEKEQENIEITKTTSTKKDITSTSTPSQVKLSTCDNCQIFINEIFPNPKGSDDGEFIELYNAGDLKVVIDNWSLSDLTDKKYYLTGTISPKEFKTVLKANSGISLNNTKGESVKLRDNLDKIIDLVIYQDSVESQSYSKFEINYFWTKQVTKNNKNILEQKIIDNNQSNKQINNTKTVEPKITTTSEAAGYSQDKNINQIIISEIYPNPGGVDMAGEFIELYNKSAEKVNLRGLLIDDIDGGSPPFKIKDDLYINPDSYISFLRTETNIALNNTDDAVRLLDSNKILLDSVTYDDAQENFSYSLVNNQYIWTSQVTQDKENIFIEEIDKQENNETKEEVFLRLSIAEALEAEDKTKVILEGIVSVLPGTIGSQYFYIQNNFGIQVYMYSKNFKELKIGDKIVVTGEISEFSGGKRIKLKDKNDVSVISSGNILLNQAKNIDMLDDADIGKLIVISGEKINNSGSIISIDDSTGELDVYIKSNTKIKKPKLQDNDILTITGVLTKYKDSYRLLPRMQQDITVKSGVITEIMASSSDKFNASSTSILNITREITGSNQDSALVQRYLIASMIISGIGLIGIFIRKKYVIKNKDDDEDSIVIQNSLDSL